MSRSGVRSTANRTRVSELPSPSVPARGRSRSGARVEPSLASLDRALIFQALCQRAQLVGADRHPLGRLRRPKAGLCLEQFQKLASALSSPRPPRGAGILASFCVPAGGSWLIDRFEGAQRPLKARVLYHERPELLEARTDLSPCSSSRSRPATHLTTRASTGSWSLTGGASALRRRRRRCP